MTWRKLSAPANVPQPSSPVLFIPHQLLLLTFLLQYHYIVVAVEWCVLEECYIMAPL